MSSLFDVGKSVVQSYRQSLAVTGQNIANINTDGYKRREAASRKFQVARVVLPVSQTNLVWVCVLLIFVGPLMGFY